MIRCVLLFLLASMLTVCCYCIIADEIAAKDDPEKHCECIDYDCGCCTQLKIEHVLDGKLCANFSYLSKDIGISATITFNGVAIYNETVSTRNPPPLCLIHIDQIRMRICLRLYDLDIKNKCFSGCGEFELNFFNVIPLRNLTIGCFGQDCKKSSSLVTEIEKTFYHLIGKTRKQNDPQPEVILI